MINWSLKNSCFLPKMLLWPFLGENSYFCTSNFSNLKLICHLYTSKLGNLGGLGRLKVYKKVKRSTQNIRKVAKTPYFITFLAISQKTNERSLWKRGQMFVSTCPFHWRDPFGCPISVGLIPKKSAGCARPCVRPSARPDGRTSITPNHDLNNFEKKRMGGQGMVRSQKKDGAED